MKLTTILFFLILSISGFAQNAKSTPLSDELQKEKLTALNSKTDKMSFAKKESYLDSLQTAGIIIRKTIPKNSKGCTLEDREEAFAKPSEEIIIFVK